MITAGAPTFIDFQGGRRGPLQYDVVSLLYQSSAQIPDAARRRLVTYYLTCASQHAAISTEEFCKYYSGFIISRMLQVLGVYGAQGLGAGKEYFRKSIPGAIDTLYKELSSTELPLQLPHLTQCAELLMNRMQENPK
jgi:aminoglycoside/choline kinase family phosphotransferase